MIRELKSRSLLLDYNVIESFKMIMHSLENLINSEKIKYTTRILLMQFLSEICKKFFHFPEILLSMKTNLKENDSTEYEEILIFSMLLNIFKTDQLIVQYENKKLVQTLINQ